MPFAFTGKPPALLNTNQPPRAFAHTTSTSVAATRAAPDSRSAGISFASRSTLPSPFTTFVGSSASSFSSFGRRPSTPAFSSTQFKPSFPSASTTPASNPSLAPTSALDTYCKSVSCFHTDDALTKALDRAKRRRPAAFGRADIVADGILDKILTTSNAGALLAKLDESPEVASFTRNLFNEMLAARLEQLASAQPTMPQSRSEDTDNGIDKYVSISTEGHLRCEVPILGAATQPKVATTCSERFQTRTAWRRHFEEYHLDWYDSLGEEDSEAASEQLSYNEVITIPRNHRRLHGIANQLSEALLDEGHTAHKEGSTIMANFIIDEYLAGRKDGLGALIMSTLGLSNTDTAVCESIARLLTWIDWSIPDASMLFEEDVQEPIPESPRCGPGSSNHEEAQIASLEPHAIAPATPARSTTPFRFLDLPAEMRNLTYEELMVPGFIGLATRYYARADRNTTFVRQSPCHPQILATCRQIFNEAKSLLYEENSIGIFVRPEVSWLPIVNKRLLPDSALSKLTSVVLVCDVTKSLDANKEFFEKVNWKQLQEMTGIKSLRICMVEREDHIGQDAQKNWILEHIVERVPKTCELSFESREGPEDDFVQAALDDLDAAKRYSQRGQFADGCEVEGGFLESLAKEHVHKQGCKSGDARDYRFPERGLPKTLGALPARGDVNPSYMLGSGQ